MTDARTPRPAATPNLLQLYLQDHEAGSAGGVRLADRCQRENAGTLFAAPLAELALEIEQEQQQLWWVMDELGVAPSRPKRVVARVGAALGRLLPNGRLRSYSPLSRVLELEALSAAVTGKLRLWQVLGDLAATDARLAPATFAVLQDAARAQLDVLAALHRSASELAFIGD